MKAILVHLNGTRSDLAVLNGALSLARLFNAHLQCTHVVPDKHTLLMRATNVDLTSTMMLTDALHKLQEEAQKRLSHAREMFFAFCEDQHVPHHDTPHDGGLVSASWHDQVGKPAAVLTRQVRCNDLIVMEAGPRDDPLFSSDDIADVIAGAGRPVLLAPPHAQIDVKSIAIAWKNCPEAARAVSAALPLLAKAQKIIALSASEQRGSAAETAESLSGITNYLAWHGLRAESVCLTPGKNRTAADAVLETAIESQAGLLVMGGFGHGRLREFVFGGFTQRVLDGVVIPVLLVH